jgi:hypothetical protein
MSERDVEAFLRMLENYLSGGLKNPTGALAVLISETVKYRDKLLAETGRVLTVNDTRAALDALKLQLYGRPVPAGLSPQQAELVRLWVERLHFSAE